MASPMTTPTMKHDDPALATLVAAYIAKYGATRCPPGEANAAMERLFTEPMTPTSARPGYWPWTEPTKEIPSQEYLRECFGYDQLTGELVWKTRPLLHFRDQDAAQSWNSINPGAAAGWTKPARAQASAFVRVSIGNFEFRAHRVIWKWVTGEEPPYVLHKNHDGTDNRWANLTAARRPVLLSTKGSRRPRGPYAPQARRGTGVCKEKNGKFRAKISINDVTISLGTHPTREAAEAAYRRAVEELG